MTHPLDSARLKINRAHEHLAAIRSEIARHKQNCSITIEPGVNPKIVNLVEKFPDPPIELSLLIGDCLYNLRSCLDHVAAQLVACNGHSPSHSQFPICSKPAAFKSASSDQLKGALPGSVTVIEGLQPYKRVERLADCPLWCINKLGNIDKHRFLTTTTVATQTLLGDIKPVKSKGANVWRVPARVADKVKMELDQGVSIAFKDAPVAGRDVGIYMYVMEQYVVNVVFPTIEEVFRKAGY